MMYKGWDYVTVVCGNHDSDDVEMRICEGPHSLFYACPKYYPDARKEGERACANRINLIEYERMLMHLSDMLEKNGVQWNLAHHKWKQKGIEFEVLSHEEKGIVVKMLNKTALK